MNNIDLISMGTDTAKTAATPVLSGLPADRDGFLNELKNVLASMAQGEEEGKKLHESNETPVSTKESSEKENNSPVVPVANPLPTAVINYDEFAALMAASLSEDNMQAQNETYADTKPLIDAIQAELDNGQVNALSGKEIPTAEQYLSYFKEVLTAAREILSTLKQDNDDEDKKEESPEDSEDTQALGALPETQSMQAQLVQAEVLTQPVTEVSTGELTISVEDQVAPASSDAGSTRPSTNVANELITADGQANPAPTTPLAENKTTTTDAGTPTVGAGSARPSAEIVAGSEPVEAKSTTVENKDMPVSAPRAEGRANPAPTMAETETADVKSVGRDAPSTPQQFARPAAEGQVNLTSAENKTIPTISADGQASAQRTATADPMPEKTSAQIQTTDKQAATKSVANQTLPKEAEVVLNHAAPKANQGNTETNADKPRNIHMNNAQINQEQSQTQQAKVVTALANSSSAENENSGKNENSGNQKNESSVSMTSSMATSTQSAGQKLTLSFDTELHNAMDADSAARSHQTSEPQAQRTTQTAPQAEAKHIDRTLEWESAKDAVKLARLVQQAGQEGATKLTVRLAPEHLGKLVIQLTEVAGRLNAKFVADSVESRNILASHGDAIVRHLADKGISIDNMDFNFHDSLAKQDAGADGQGAKQSRERGDKNGTTQHGNNGTENANENTSEGTPTGLYA